ncbi:MAG: alcohol dehydrogenase catalytic domain-containing protein [Anaerolineales bacterium]|nr:alcohol dehydrogenase catalytic domain-containing protein [Anaerolineales bacterium]
MKAVLFHEHGGLDVLRYEDFPTPAPGPDEVLVRLRAAALNRVDLWVRQCWPGLKLDLPHISGSDGAGVIAAVGAEVDDLKQGDRVVINANIGCGKCDFCRAGYDNRCRDWHLLGETIRGTLAEYVAVPARNVLPLPDDMHFGPAAAASLVYLTAWHSLITRGKLQPGERVLVVGASGGVNTACIQIASFTGAQVLVIGSNAEKLSLAESLGADILIDRSKEENWSKAVFLATGREGVDVVVDNVGAGSMMMSMRAARKGGRILTVGNTGGAMFEIDNRFIFGKHLSILGSTMGTLQDFETVMGLVFEGKLQPVIDRTYPLQETAEAERRLEAGEQMGKIVIDIES